jgi:hypothetical protein
MGSTGSWNAVRFLGERRVAVVHLLGASILHQELSSVLRRKSAMQAHRIFLTVPVLMLGLALARGAELAKQQRCGHEE